jgi:arylformamidase
MKYDDTPWLEEQYNNRIRVPEHGEHLAAWARESAQVRASRPCHLDIAYGPTAGQKLDVFPATSSRAPVVVFIHGGYWRSLDKSEHSFVAPMFNDAGACVVVPNYDLCPAVTIPQIVLQTASALAWVWHHIDRFGGDPRRISLVGHSAGGHLAAMMLACYWNDLDRSLPSDLVTRVLSISGVFDLEPLRHVPSLQQTLGITPEQVLQASPARFPAPRLGELFTVAGGKESMEFLRQNELVRQAWGSARVPVCEALPGLNHFNVLEAMVQPGHRLNQLALQLLR